MWCSLICKCCSAFSLEQLVGGGVIYLNNEYWKRNKFTEDKEKNNFGHIRTKMIKKVFKCTCSRLLFILMGAETQKWNQNWWYILGEIKRYKWFSKAEMAWKLNTVSVFSIGGKKGVQRPEAIWKRNSQQKT